MQMWKRRDSVTECWRLCSLQSIVTRTIDSTLAVVTGPLAHPHGVYSIIFIIIYFCHMTMAHTRCMMFQPIGLFQVHIINQMFYAFLVDHMYLKKANRLKHCTSCVCHRHMTKINTIDLEIFIIDKYLSGLYNTEN